MSENRCDCGQWKGEDFELCRECAEQKREEEREPVDVSHFGKIKETDKALLFKLAKGFAGRSVWVPKSILVEEIDDATFTVPRWWAEQENLE